MFFATLLFQPLVFLRTSAENCSWSFLYTASANDSITHKNLVFVNMYYFTDAWLIDSFYGWRIETDLIHNQVEI